MVKTRKTKKMKKKEEKKNEIEELIYFPVVSPPYLLAIMGDPGNEQRNFEDSN